MRFLFVVSGKDVPSTRFRILPYLPMLQQAGHTCDVAYSLPQKYDYFPAIGWRLSQLLKRAVRHVQAQLAQSKNYDAIVIEREVFDDETWNIEEKLRRATNRLIIDVDDAIFLLHPTKFDRIVRMCDAAVGGNRFLTDYLQTRCAQVVQIPTCVRLSEYPLRDPSAQRSQRPVIGWIGTTQNVAFLSVAARALRRAAAKHPFRLVVVAPSPERLAELELSGVDVDFHKWHPRTEVALLSDMDFGLMPLPADQEWMKYKCGLKLIQYLAIGIPGIASPIGVNEEILLGQRVGRAASNEHQWYAAIEELIDSPALRQELGRAGRTTVEQHYSIEGNWKRLEQVLIG